MNQFKSLHLFVFSGLFLSALIIRPGIVKQDLGTPSQEQWVRQKLTTMTTRDKIAQMVISSTFGENYDESSGEYKRMSKLCKEDKIGGFIFFKGSSSGYANLSNKLQELSETPLLISADFERGTGMRVTDGTLFPNNMAIGATGNPSLAYKMGLVIARESRSLGVHQNYAPVCDVNNNPNNPIINVRSFGEDPKLVSRMSEMMIKGLQEGSVIATAKHFPGHGDTEIDSHKDLPVLNFSMDRLNQIELVPFKNAVEKNVMSVMIAHLSFPELEPIPNVPASLSESIVQGLLIDKLGFNGLIVTDALNMKGITKYFSPSQVAVMCVKAGIDLILMPMDETAAIDAIEKAVADGDITSERIDKSAEKILKAKSWLGLNENKYVNSADVYKNVNTLESNLLAQQIANESITLVKDDFNVIPLKKKSKILVLNLSDGKDNGNSAAFSAGIKERFPDAEIIDITSEIADGELSIVAEENLKSFDYVVAAVYAKVRFGTGKISVLPSQARLLNSFPDKTKLAVISFGNPYILKEFPDIPSYICAYGDADVSINAVFMAIMGEIRIKGKLPVSISAEYRIGAGLER